MRKLLTSQIYSCPDIPPPIQYLPSRVERNAVILSIGRKGENENIRRKILQNNMRRIHYNYLETLILCVVESARLLGIHYIDLGSMKKKDKEINQYFQIYIEIDREARRVAKTRIK